eukprot:jgi/Tetstr1/447702/TSEL_035059.t1
MSSQVEGASHHNATLIGADLLRFVGKALSKARVGGIAYTYNAQHYAPNQIMGGLSAAEERIYEEREDVRTIAGGLRKETTPRHERFDGATSIWTEWFNSYNANVLLDAIRACQGATETNPEG